MNSIAVVFRRCVGIEFRVETPSANRLAEKKTGRVFTKEIMFVESIVIHISKVDVARHLQWEAPARSLLRRRRFLPLLVHRLLGALSPSKHGYGHRQAENLELKPLHDERVPHFPFRKGRPRVRQNREPSNGFYLTYRQEW